MTESRNRTPRVVLPVLGALLILGAVGSALFDGGRDAASSRSAAAAPAKSADAVTIKGFLYKPAAIEVARGTRVTWTNDDSTAHTASAKDGGGFDTGAVQGGGAKKTVTLSKAGKFAYYCKFHPTMAGTVTVK